VRLRVNIPPELFTMLRKLIEAESGMVLSDAKLAHLSSVVRGRMAALGLSDAWDYLSMVGEGTEAANERRELVTELLIGETSFYRTPGLYQVFQESILPELPDRGVVPPVQVWSAGCSTGEEAYSIAMAALEWSRGRHAVPARVWATDLHRGALDIAREGIYPAQALRELPERLRTKYFEPLDGGRFRVSDAVRHLVRFEELNLMEFLSRPPGDDRFAAIFCRNVMIYFRADTTRRLVERFHDRLVDGGVLFLGHSETLWGISDAFRLEQREKVFYYRKPAAAPPAPPVAAAPGAGGAPRPSPRESPTGAPGHAAEGLFVSPAMERVLEAERKADADQPEESLRLCREAAALDPSCIEADYLMALLLRRGGRYAEALFHAERALSTDPRFVLAEVEAAECLSLMGKPAEAASRWKEVLRSIEGDVRFPRLSAGDGVSRKTLRHYVISRMPH